MLDLDMGAYGAFVWPSWIISALVLGGLAARSALTARRWKAELKRLEPTSGSGEPTLPDQTQATRSAAAPQ